MKAPTFRNKAEIEAVTMAVAELMHRWGLKPSDWMIGKYLSHFFIGMVPKPQDVIRDINLYVLKDKLPWPIKKQSRSIIPPAGRYFAAYNRLQTKHRVSLDFMPLPDEYLSSSFINRKREEIVIGGQRINLESAEKFIYRLEKLSREFSGKSVAEFREFYYADKKRYLDRLAFYGQVADFLQRIKRKDLLARMQAVIAGYKKLIHWAYPELFTKKRNFQSSISQITGSSVVPSAKKITGTVKIYNAQESLPRRRQKFIYVFTHFFPGDARILPYAKAIITEGGGLLSHAAIVCRELKTLCIVDTKNAAKVLRSGDQVTLDLKHGLVKLVKRKP